MDFFTTVHSRWMGMNTRKLYIRYIVVLLLVCILWILFSSENRLEKTEDIVKTNLNVISATSTERLKIKTSVTKEQRPIFRRVSHTELQKVYSKILRWNNVTEEKEKDSFLNHHRFIYSLNPNICRDSFPNVIIFVQSSVDHAKQRASIRRTWGAINRVRNMTFNTVFILGQTTKAALQKNVEKEFAKFGDIMQGNFLDSYTNLTYKHIMALGWISSKCPNASLIVKVDDDTILNIFNLVDYLTKTGFRERFLYCSVYFHQGPVRRTNDKWYVSRNTYPFDNYPDYCEGFGYLMSPDVARLLYKASENSRFYWVDDVYVTGILTLKVGLQLTSFQEGHSYRRSSLARITEPNAMFISSKYNWDRNWNTIMQYVANSTRSTQSIDGLNKQH